MQTISVLQAPAMLRVSEPESKQEVHSHWMKRRALALETRPKFAAAPALPSGKRMRVVKRVEHLRPKLPTMFFGAQREKLLEPDVPVIDPGA